MEDKHIETASAATEAEKNLNERIEDLSNHYIDFLKQNLESPMFINPDAIRAINDSIRVLRHLREMNDKPFGREHHE